MSYTNYKKWMLSHRLQHNLNQQEQHRVKTNYYQKLPQKIESIKKDLIVWQRIKRLRKIKGWTLIVKAWQPIILNRIANGYYQRQRRLLKKYKAELARWSGEK